jgi:hypothetical protein
MASSDTESSYLNWICELPVSFWGEKWALDTYGPDYSQKTDRVQLHEYVPATSKTEAAYKFHLRKSKNSIIGLTELNAFKAKGYLTGHDLNVYLLLLFVTSFSGVVMVAATATDEKSQHPAPKKTLGVRKRPVARPESSQHIYPLYT